MATYFLVSAAVIFCFMVVMFLIAQAVKDNSIVDIGWGIGFILVALATLIYNGSFLPRQVLTTTLVALWGIRLAGYIGKRNIGKPEDYRYRQWREKWGKWVVIRAFFQVFMLQGIIMFIVTLPIVVVNSSAGNPQLDILAYIGLALWVIGFYFEAVGDYQKSQFKQDSANEGKIMQSGLWAYTRHPNYFGEAVMWWAIFIIAIPSGYWYISLIGPLVIHFFLVYVSGVAMLERKYDEDSRYDDYKKRTNAFFPWFPKS